MVEDEAERGLWGPFKNLSYHPKKEGEPSKDFKKGPQPELHPGTFLLMVGKDNQREQRSLETSTND